MLVTPESMQKFCLELLLPAIDAKIDELTNKPRLAETS